MAADDEDDDAYVIGDLEVTVEDDPIPSDWQNAAVYTLDQAAKCPYCREPIRTLRVIKMARTQAAFTSTLPRSGRAFVCPNCERLLSLELSGII